MRDNIWHLKGGVQGRKRKERRNVVQAHSLTFRRTKEKTHHISGFSILQINTLYLTDFFLPCPAACNHA